MFAILGAGLLPLLGILSQARTVTVKSALELRAIAHGGATLAALKTVASSTLLTLVGKTLRDEDLGAGLSPALPPTDPTIRRQIRISLVNDPRLPGDRFTNPWGKVLEFEATLVGGKGDPILEGRPIAVLRDFLHLGLPDDQML